MGRTAISLVAAAIGLVASPVRAEPLILQPNGPWNVDFAEDKCRLTGLFGEEGNQHFLSFEQYWPSSVVGLTAAGSAFRKFTSLTPTEMTTYDSQAPLRTEPFIGIVEGFGNGVVLSSFRFDQPSQELSEPDGAMGAGLPQLDVEVGKRIRYLQIRQGGRVVKLETGKLDEAFKVLNQCTLDLVRDWGLDADRHLTVQSRPRWLNQDSLVRKIVASYPSGSAGEQGIMQMRVIVSAEGAVENCTILEATRNTNLKSPACAIMGRARFAPAVDANGQPFRSYYVNSITYRID